jgi:hypothetical protein
MKLWTAIVLLVILAGCSSVPRLHLYNATQNALHAVTEYGEYTVAPRQWLVVVDGSVPRGMRFEREGYRRTYRIDYPPREWMEHTLFHDELFLRLEVDGELYVVAPTKRANILSGQPAGYPLLGTARD